MKRLGGNEPLRQENQGTQNDANPSQDQIRQKPPAGEQKPDSTIMRIVKGAQDHILDIEQKINANK